MDEPMIPPAYSKDRHLIFQGDCLEILPTIEKSTIRLVFADPPYNIGKSFGNNKDYWPTKEMYFSWCKKWIAECSRILTEDGSMFVMGHPQYVPHIMTILEDNGLHFTNQIIYHYSDGMPETDLFERRYEPILYYRKDKEHYVFNLNDVRVEPIRYDRYSNPRGKNPSDVWEINRVRWNSRERVSLSNGKIAHVAQKPIKLLERIILACSNPGDTVLDPFLGTGTTSVVAKMKNRKSIGIELNPEYVNIAIERIENTSPDTFSPRAIHSNIKGIEEDFKKMEEWVIPRDRSSFPLTNDFHAYFAAFPPEMVDRLLAKYSRETHKVLDPFCGGGSTLVESVRLNRVGIGFDISPLAVLISKVKSTPIHIEKSKVSQFLAELGNKMLDLNMKGGIDESIIVPNREFLEKWFPETNLFKLASILEIIERERDPDFQDFLKVAFSSIVRKCSWAKNAEQHLSRKKEKTVQDPAQVLRDKLNLMVGQMNAFYQEAKDKPKPDVRVGDARKLTQNVPEKSVDAIITSPPYGTGSKYTGVYRLSFEWLKLEKPNGNQSLELSPHFSNELKTCIGEVYKVLKPNKYLCFVYGDPSSESGLTRQAILDCKEVGFHYHGLISCPIAKEKFNHGTAYRRFIPKDFILIFQK